MTNLSPLMAAILKTSSFSVRFGAWDDNDQGFISLIDDEFLTVGKFALWKAVPYPAVVEDMAKLVGAWQA